MYMIVYGSLCSPVAKKHENMQFSRRIRQSLPLVMTMTVLRQSTWMHV